MAIFSLVVIAIYGCALTHGLITGRMPPIRGGSYDRKTAPRLYWLQGALYGALIALFLYFIWRDGF